jgi:hypothetical protein
MEALSLVINQPDEFLQKIGWNKDQIKESVATIIKQYTGVTYTEEQLQEAKKDRAALNAMRSGISNRRIQVKKALMAPYDVFEAEVKEVVAMIDKPIAMIDEQISEYEERVKQDKKAELSDYFKENIGNLEDVLTFDMIFNVKWLNKTASIKSCKDEIMQEITKTETDIKFIDTMIPEKYRGYAKDYYFRNKRNMSSVLNEVGRMKEVDRKKEEEGRQKKEREEAERLRKAQEETEAAEREKIKKLQEEAETEKIISQTNESATDMPGKKPSEEKDSEENNNIQSQSQTQNMSNESIQDDKKIYKSSFTIRGTKAQILAVKDFMIANNIEFGKVER